MTLEGGIKRGAPAGLAHAVRAALLAGALAAPAHAQDPYAQADLRFEQQMNRLSLRDRLKSLKQTFPALRAEVPFKGRPEAGRLDEGWQRVFLALSRGLRARFEMGGIHAGSIEEGRGVALLGKGNRSDSFVVDDEMLKAVLGVLSRMHLEGKGDAPYDVCVVHTHPRTLPGLPITEVVSLPPSASDLKDIVDPSLAAEFAEYVGRPIRYREAVVDATGMWVFEAVGKPAVELSQDSARRIYDAQLVWARLAATPGLTFTTLIAAPEYARLRATYREFGVALEYVSHEEARKMPLCRK